MPAALPPFDSARAPLLTAVALPPPVVDLACTPLRGPGEAAPYAVSAWRDHVAAGRIGAPPPPAAAGELRLAALACILGHEPHGAP